MLDSSPSQLAILQALLVPTIAVVGTWIALQQLHIARERARYDAFDRRWERRFAVYEATRKFLADVYGDMSEDKIREYGLWTLEAKFLFDERMYSYLREVLSRVQVWYTAKTKGDSESHDAERREYKRIESENISWIRRQGDEISEFDLRFRPYLVLGEAATRSRRWSGWWRLWIIASSLWSIAVFQDPIWWGHWSEHSEPHPRDWLSLLFFLLAPWLLTAAVFSVRWMVGGFRRAE